MPLDEETKAENFESQFFQTDSGLCMYDSKYIIIIIIILRNFLLFVISENFPLRKLWHFVAPKRTLPIMIKENNHFLCISKSLKFH